MNLLDIFLFTMNSIMPLILMILLGYWLKKINFFSPDFLKYGNKTVFYVCLPVLLFKNISEIESLSEVRWDAVGYVMCVIILLYIVGALLTRFVEDPKQKGVIHQCVFRSNFALIGVPLAELMAGAEGVRVAAVLSLFTIPTFNVLAVVVLSIYKKDSSGANISKHNMLTDVLKNPLIIGVVLGFAVIVLRQVMNRAGILNVFSKDSQLLLSRWQVLCQHRNFLYCEVCDSAGFAGIRWTI